MNIKINCVHNDQGAWCTNKKVKRSLFGIGARVCCEYNGKKCELKEKTTRKAPPPPSPTVKK